MLYTQDMIMSFRHKGLKRFFEDGERSKLPAALLARIELILLVLDSSSSIEGVNRPSFRLHALKGDLNGYWSITVRANWRIIFRMEGDKVLDVDFLDYH